MDIAFPHDAEVSYRSESHRAKELVLLVVQGLRGRDDDGLSRVDPHRVHVLHVANRDAIVANVPNDFILDLLPPTQILLDKDLLDAPRKGALECLDELLFALDNTASLPSECKGTSEHHREPDFESGLAGFGNVFTRARARDLDANLPEPLVEKLSILGVSNRLNRWA